MSIDTRLCLWHGLIVEELSGTSDLLFVSESVDPTLLIARLEKAA